MPESIIHRWGILVIKWLVFPRKLHELAEALAVEISRRYPSAIANSPEPLVSPGRRSEILNEVFTRAERFSSQNDLGVFATIRLGSALKWRLKELGYDDKFIDIVAQHLVASVSQRK